MRLSRAEGFTFNTTVVNNRDNNGVYLAGVEKPSSPTLSRFDVISPGVDGSESHKNRYEDKEIVLTIAIYKENIKERRSIQRAITRGLLGKQDKLYFHDEPTMYHIGEVFEEITVNEDEFFTELEVTFKCKPFIYQENSSAKWTNITTTLNTTIKNDGNFKASPIIKIEGTADRVGVRIGDAEFSIANVKATTYVDVANMNVYIIESNKKKSVLQDFQGLFPKIPEGTTPVVISGTTMKVNVDIQFANTYIC